MIPAAGGGGGSSSAELHFNLIWVVPAAARASHSRKVIDDASVLGVAVAWRLNILQLTVVFVAVIAKGFLARAEPDSLGPIDSAVKVRVSLFLVLSVESAELAEGEDSLTLTGHDNEVLLVVKVEELGVLLVAANKKANRGQHLRVFGATYFRWMSLRLSMVSRRESMMRG